MIEQRHKNQIGQSMKKRSYRDPELEEEDLSGDPDLEEYDEPQSKKGILPVGTKRPLQYDGDDDVMRCVDGVASLFQTTATQQQTLQCILNPPLSPVKNSGSLNNKENASPKFNVPAQFSLSPQKSTWSAKVKELGLEEFDSNFLACTLLLNRLASHSRSTDVVQSALEVFAIDKDSNELVDTLERIERSPYMIYPHIDS